MLAQACCQNSDHLAGFRNRTARRVELGCLDLVPVSFLQDSKWTGAEQPFDPSSVPLLSDRRADSLSNYEQEADFKAIAISREGFGVALGASDIDTAKREALDRCQQRDPKGNSGSTPSGTRFVGRKLRSHCRPTCVGPVGHPPHAG